LPLKLTIELSDEDLRHFRKTMKEARARARTESEEEILESAGALLEAVSRSKAPAYVRKRLACIGTLIEMLRDPDWALSGENRERVLSALAYFNEPADLIPDDIPGFGYLDDAVMVELVVQELAHDLEAYDDFCAFRKQVDGRRKPSSRKPETQRRLEARRRQLHRRMRQRRLRRRARASARMRSPFTLW